MLRLRVPPQISTQRMNHCLACKYFKHQTKSCGTLFIGGKIDPEEEQEIKKQNTLRYKKKRITLCGCKMPIKVHLAFAQCPINKWSAYYLHPEEITELRAFMSTIPRTGKIPSQDVDRIYDWLYRITKQKQPRCGDCLKYLIHEINSNLKSNEINYEEAGRDQDESQQSQSDQGREVSPTGEVDQGVSRDAGSPTNSGE